MAMVIAYWHRHAAGLGKPVLGRPYGGDGQRVVDRAVTGPGHDAGDRHRSGRGGVLGAHCPVSTGALGDLCLPVRVPQFLFLHDDR